MEQLSPRIITLIRGIFRPAPLTKDLSDLACGAGPALISFMPSLERGASTISTASSSQAGLFFYEVPPGSKYKSRRRGSIPEIAILQPN
jgi:hypothetical protein